ncbi:glycosyltransferase [Candidatus Woesearchaeota archaeon]|nr:glycosyltransferase [Candidatus Woesearchaeota archaeon]
MLPKISLVIITKNEEKNIRDCLDSVTSLDYPKDRLEIIVVDTSTDKTPDIARSYKDVKLIRGHKAGFGHVRNMGIEKAKNELVAFTDADCIVPRDWLKKLVAPFKNENVAAAGGNAYPPENAPYLGKCFSCLGVPAGGAIGLDACIEKTSTGASALVTCNAVFRREVLVRIKFNENLRFGGEDTDISKRIRNEGYSLKYVPDSFVWHKPRTSLSDFARWHYRRGIADFYLKKGGFLRAFFGPFSVLWLIIFITLLGILTKTIGFYALFFLLVTWISLIALMISTKRYRLLARRRKRIKIGAFSLLFAIPFLFYLRRFIIDLAQVKVMLFGTGTSIKK